MLPSLPSSWFGHSKAGIKTSKATSQLAEAMASGACWRLQNGVGTKLEFHVTCKAVWAAEELGGCETKGGSGR